MIGINKPALLLLVALGWSWAGGAAAQQAQRLATTPLRAGMHMIQAQLAIEPEERATGLMHRRDMPQHEGMLFVFETREIQCFWMRNTLLPLSIAFLADDGRIVSMADMKPLDETSHCSAEPVRFALEMNQGWFAKRGFKPGMKLQGKPFGN
jgi:hypothetical protein